MQILAHLILFFFFLNKFLPSTLQPAVTTLSSPTVIKLPFPSPSSCPSPPSVPPVPGRDTYSAASERIQPNPACLSPARTGRYRPNLACFEPDALIRAVIAYSYIYPPILAKSDRRLRQVLVGIRPN